VNKLLAALAVFALAVLGLSVAPSSALASGTLSGTITDSFSAPINGAVVEFKQNSSTNYYYSDASGALTGFVPAGTYTVFIHATGYAPEYYNNSYTVAGAAAVVVTDGGSVTINASLDTDSVISGTITDYLGGPVTGQVFAYADNDPSAQPERGFTDPLTGAYTIPDLAPGGYQIFVYTDSNDNLVDEWYNNAYMQSAATTVTLPAPGSAAVVDVSLALGGSIAGSVTNSIGTPISDFYVAASGTLGGSNKDLPLLDGTYAINGLLPDTYSASVTDDSGFFQTSTVNGLVVTTSTPAAADFVLTPTLVDESEFSPRAAVGGPTTVEAGKTYTWTVTADGDSDVYAILYSTPVYLGAAVQNPDGTATLTLTIPASTKAGAHKLTYSSYYDNIPGFDRAYFDLTVTAAPLAATGVDSSALIVGGMALLAVGGGILFMRRRLA